MRHISNFRSLRLRLIETGEVLYLNSNFKINIFIYRKDTSSLVMHKEYIKRQVESEGKFRVDCVILQLSQYILLE